MSWSVSAIGKVGYVKESLKEQFAFPLAEGEKGLPFEEEKETVRKVSDMIFQCLDTFGPDRNVTVSAAGHMNFDSWEDKSNPFQNVEISIQV